MTANEVENFIAENFGVLRESVFAKYPQYGVFRQKDNQKWFALLMDAPVQKFELSANAKAKFRGEILVLNLKCRPDLAHILIDGEKILPAYYMNKKHWISVNLSCDIGKNVVCDLITQSFELTRAGLKARK